MEDLMQSITANLKKARDGRRRVEIERDRSQNLLAKSIIKTEICSEISSSNPQISVGQRCDQCSHSQNKRCKDHVHLHVCLNSRKCSDYIIKFFKNNDFIYPCF